MDVDLIISFTTFDVRLRSGCANTMLTSILNQETDLKYKIVMNVAEKDICEISESLKEIIDKNNIEILVCKTDLKSHNKYFYVMNKYKDIPIITVDDDQIYPQTLIKELYESYLKFPNCVSGRRCHLMLFNKNLSLKSYNLWEAKIKKIYESPRLDLFATGVGGVLYPPDILKITENDIEIVNKTKTADDFALKYFELRNNVKVVNVKNDYYFKPIPIKNNVELYSTNIRKNDDYLYLLNQFFYNNIETCQKINYTNKLFSISTDELFKNSFVISIDNDRLDLFKKIFNYNNLKIPHLYKGHAISNMHGTSIAGHVNCQFSHLSVIKMAQYLELPFVCIFEDDTYPCLNISQKLEYYLTDIPDDCECLALGNIYLKYKTLVNNKFLTDIGHIIGGHAYIVFQNAYDKIINLYYKTSMHNDILLSSLKLYAPKQNLFIQYNEKSSSSKFVGYTWKEKTFDKIFEEFPKIEIYK